MSMNGYGIGILVELYPYTLQTCDGTYEEITNRQVILHMYQYQV